jgi:peptidoglycan-N-acetylglucosamine deacetylase
VTPLRENIFSHWLWRLPFDSGRVILTFDDGPSPDTTPRLMDELDRLQIVSTHFLLGSECRQHEDLVKRIASTGHVVANHSFVHEGFRLKTGGAQRTSVARTDEVIREAIGEGASLFRPPYGSFNFRTLPTLKSLGYSGVLWSVVARDWVPQSDDDLWNRLSTELHEGAIILLHDGHPTTQAVIRILPRLAEEVARHGWRFSTLTSSDFKRS